MEHMEHMEHMDIRTAQKVHMEHTDKKEQTVRYKECEGYSWY